MQACAINMASYFIYRVYAYTHDIVDRRDTQFLHAGIDPILLAPSRFIYLGRRRQLHE